MMKMSVFTTTCGRCDMMLPTGNRPETTLGHSGTNISSTFWSGCWKNKDKHAGRRACSLIKNVHSKEGQKSIAAVIFQTAAVTQFFCQGEGGTVVTTFCLLRRICPKLPPVRLLSRAASAVYSPTRQSLILMLEGRAMFERSEPEGSEREHIQSSILTVLPVSMDC